MPLIDQDQIYVFLPFLLAVEHSWCARNCIYPMFLLLLTTLQFSIPGFRWAKEAFQSYFAVGCVNLQWSRGRKWNFTGSKFYSRLCNFLKILQSPNKMGMIIPILKMRKWIVQNSTPSEWQGLQRPAKAMAPRCVAHCLHWDLQAVGEGIVEGNSLHVLTG